MEFEPHAMVRVSCGTVEAGGVPTDYPIVRSGETNRVAAEPLHVSGELYTDRHDTGLNLCQPSKHVLVEVFVGVIVDDHR